VNGNTVIASEAKAERQVSPFSTCSGQFRDRARPRFRAEDRAGVLHGRHIDFAPRIRQSHPAAVHVPLPLDKYVGKRILKFAVYNGVHLMPALRITADHEYFITPEDTLQAPAEPVNRNLDHAFVC
jgi:hypothetical protein